MKTLGCFGSGMDGTGKNNKPIDEYETYLQRKKSVKLPKNIEKYFSLLQQINKIGYKKLFQKSPTQFTSNITQNFCKNFDRLSKLQQNHYLLELIIEVDRRIFDKEQLKIEKTLTIDSQLNETLGDSTKYIESECRYCSLGQATLGFIKHWRDVNIKLCKQKKRLIVKQKKSLFQIPLRSYVLRKKQKLTLIIQSTHDFEQTIRKAILFQFKQSGKDKFELLYKNILDVIVSTQIDKLMMENVFNQKFDKLDDTKRNRIYLHLSENGTQRCKNKIDVFEKESKIQKTYQRIVLSQQFSNQQTIKISQFKNNQGTWYQGYSKIHDRHETRLINFMEIYQNSHKFLTKFSILQTINEQNILQSQKQLNQEDTKLCAFYQKLKINDKVYGQQLFLLKIRRKQQNQQIFLFTNLDHAFNENFIQYMKIVLEPSEKISEQCFFVRFIVKFNQSFESSKLHQQHFVQFLKQFYTMFQRLRNNSVQQHSQINVGQMNSKFFIEKDLISRFGQQQQQPTSFLKKESSPTGFNPFIKRLDVTEVPLNAYLRRKHRMIPTTQKIGKLMKQHFLYKQWQRLPKGGLKCINYELVDFQKSLYKAVMRKFGQNLLKGRNIINFSLPVVCFKKQSHLQSLAQSMCYCPIHLEKAAKIKDPLQKMKFSVVIMIAVGILTVQSQKPFNPILGETYQGYVDGCPVYLQQISHHPPISAYYMVGRGYKMYGSVEPRISLLFNGATGYSNLPHYIQFDDGTIIELIFARITITGMLIGDRQFYFQDKIYAFDKKNNLFTQLIFGPFKSGGIFSRSSEPQDYFHGKIYEVSNSFKQLFNKSTPRVYPTKKDIIREHLMFDGIWSGSLHIDGEQVINFKTDLPYQFVQEQYPIPSDSRHRKDLQKLVEGDKEQAQVVKQEMQQQQRKDKRLRNKQQK